MAASAAWRRRVSQQLTTWSQTRGKLIGKAYGEAFRQHKGHPYPHSNILADLLGPLCHVAKS